MTVCSNILSLGQWTHLVIQSISENTDIMYHKIINDPLQFGAEFTDEARDILTGLLTRDPSRRLGLNGAEEIRHHPFFNNHIDFKKLSEKKIQPPFKPTVSSPVVRLRLPLLLTSF